MTEKMRVQAGIVVADAHLVMPPGDGANEGPSSDGWYGGRVWLVATNDRNIDNWALVAERAL